MPTARDVLTHAALAMLQTIAAAPRPSHMLPGARTYLVRQLKEALNELLFDRGSRRASERGPLSGTAGLTLWRTTSTAGTCTYGEVKAR